MAEMQSMQPMAPDHNYVRQIPRHPREPELETHCKDRFGR